MLTVLCDQFSDRKCQSMYRLELTSISRGRRPSGELDSGFFLNHNVFCFTLTVLIPRNNMVKDTWDVESRM